MKFFVDYILEVLIILPLFSSFCLLFIKEENSILIKIFSLWMSCLIFCISVLLWIFFDARVVLQYVSYYDILPMFYTKYMIGIDGLSIFFILLTALLVPLCCLCSWDSIKQRVRDFFICLFMVEFCVFNVFVSMDLLYFYIFFELLMIPMFIMILGWGSRVRRVHAAYYFFFYTLFGSFFMLSAIIYIYQEIGSTNIFVLLDTEFTFLEQLCLWMALFISLIIKIPLVPVHIWLPEAHVESPTTGSVLLAGILLKMGPYGLWRFVLPVYTEASQYFIDFTMCLGIITILLGSLATIRQVDIKKMIAYSSVGHMGVVYIGLILDDKIAFVGNVYLMIAHGITSSGLFLCAGCLYDRYHTRLISYYAGVQESMPVLANFFFFFVAANFGLPGFGNFVGEILVFLSSASTCSFLMIDLLIGIFLGTVYNLWLVTRILHLDFLEDFENISDVNLREFVFLSILLFIIILMGLFPNVLIMTIVQNLHYF